MKNTILIFALTLFSFASYCQDFWEHVNTPDSTYINDIVVDSSGKIYLAVSEIWIGKGGVYRSENNGESWVQFRNGLSYAHMLALAVDGEDNLFIGGASIYKSVDHAETWRTVLTANFQNSIVIRCGYDSIVLVCSVYQFGIVRSGDHGETWENVLSLNMNECINDICFGPNGAIYACSSTQYSGIGNIYQSVDLGKTWQEFPREGYYTTLGFDNQDRLIAGTYGEGIYRYDFTSSIWEHILIGGTPNDILVLPDDNIFLSWSYGRILQSNDGGENYFSNSSGIPEMNEMRNFAFDKQGRILVHGAWLYRSFDTLLTVVPSIDPEKKNILKCYPNPFSDYTNFHFITNDDLFCEADLYIYNSNGLLMLHNKIMCGRTFRWDATNMSSGVYIVRISNRNFSYTNKLIHHNYSPIN
ncbi:MAG: T9SS type A sorting domain-containing protein [Lentimicrobium sp.]|jgi:hypothetical protein|nr:T9SS type A sorting domain-containing protein [Lentimicrobium sp.]